MKKPGLRLKTTDHPNSCVMKNSPHLMRSGLFRIPSSIGSSVGYMKNNGYFEIEVVVFANLRRYLPDLRLGDTKTIHVPQGSTIAQVCDLLGVPREEVKVIMRNKRQVEMDALVEEGDRVAFIPAAGGG